MIGESPRGVPNNLMPYILQVASGRLPVLRIFGDDYKTPDGTAMRDFIHVMDLAEGHAAALKLDKRGAHIVNLGTGKPSSVKELIACVEGASGIKIKQQVEARREGDLESVYANVDKAKSLLGWTASRTLEDACRDGWKWAKTTPNGFQ